MTESQAEPKRLIVVGAGPKAAAIGAKAAVLSGLGYHVPEIVVIDSTAWGAHWDGSCGLTDGLQPLGTAPEKDVGFPYESIWGAAVDREMVMFSWQAYLVSQSRYKDWVDRGKPHPWHTHWAEYLRWVADKSGLIDKTIVAAVQTANVVDSQWHVSCSGPRLVKGDGVVVTGPGPIREFHGQNGDKTRVFDGQDFWSRLSEVDAFRPDETVGVVGAGETAGAIAAEILRRTRGKRIAVSIINSSGALYTRGESYQESRLFSEAPEEWQTWTEEEREAFIARTDRGVISPGYMSRLDAVQPVKVRVDRISISFDEVQLYDRRGDLRVCFSYIVNASGFNGEWFLDCLPKSVRGNFPKAVAAGIDESLSISGFTPALHLPMLSALAQGPGFPNLSCLGLVADRILEPYISGSKTTS